MNNIIHVVEKYEWHPDFWDMDIFDPNQQEVVAEILLHICSRKEDIESMEILIDSGTNVDVIGDIGNTPLHEAAICGKVMSVKLLLRHGANTKIKNEFGQTALDVAEIGGDKGIIDLLKEASSDPSKTIE
jgi:ankyrin repeat protein